MTLEMLLPLKIWRISYCTINLAVNCFTPKENTLAYRIIQSDRANMHAGKKGLTGITNHGDFLPL